MVMDTGSRATRRSFLKAGAIAAAPLAAVAAPAAAIADDDGRARLARIEDERAIEALGRDFFRRFNAGGARGAAGLLVRSRRILLPGGVTRLVPDPAGDPARIAIAGDAASAVSRLDCIVEREQPLEGEETLVQMARLQGNPAARHSERRTLIAEYVRLKDRWAIAGIRLT